MARATLSLRACDKRDPFIAVLDVFPENRERVMELVELCKEYERSGDCVKLGPVQAAENFQPWSYGEAVLAVARATDRKIDAVSQSMQRLYEGGRMSYPRSSASAVTGDGLASISKIADANGVRFDPSKLPMFSRTQRHAHESPRPISGQVDISSPLLVLSNDEATLSLLARHLLACGQPHAIHRPDPNALPQWARGIVFERKVCQWLRPWPRRPASPGVRELPIEEAAMELLITNGLGRPSTLVNHAIKFASRGLLDSTMSLTDKAREWISGTPQVLLDVTTSKRIEALIDQSAERDDPDSAPPRLVRSILDHFGLWQDVSPKLEHSGSGLVSAASLQDR
jgi:DNA topoisomerase-1